ncbi:Ssn2p Ecym_4094 [Eremothecium cymbalariae DBVPG|uniref:Mediator of RNA polymerase II transcription subunit 13 n=1 Tax=Eremothecium cymbalariae (strain CBS 270.75 / DBVPG 7215 / KCTC 17166 / NRRL Y-17582) TaxID=931890 RepID=G8JT20_ERECY|nr:hypothetical protein Ecym_4094 [Eremothecium cymbalariae DBVPG\
MDILDTSFRLEDVLTSYYRVEKVARINYQQFVPRTSDDQWCIQSELLLRKRDPKVLVALFSRELWCFSINDDKLPVPGAEGASEPSNSEKKGNFTPDFSKPNLPTPYAIFLKALRRMIHINMCLNSRNKLIPFGNSCIFQQNDKSSKMIHFDSHLFENGDLTVSFCTKDLNFQKLTPESFNSPRLSQKALYIAPSGIRAYLPSGDINNCLAAPPKNSNLLLVTLLVSHGIDLTQAADVKWVKLLPNLNHLNGYTPTISRYSEEAQTSKPVIWPMELCFTQSPADSVNYSRNKTPVDVNLQESFDIIDDFIQLKLTSAYRIPGSSVNANTATGNNPMSTGGGFIDQFQTFTKQPNSSGGNNVTSSFKNKLTPNKLQDSSRTGPPFSNDTFSNGFMTTPNVNENIASMMDDMIICPSSVKSQNDLWNDRKSSNDENGSLNTESQQPDLVQPVQKAVDEDIEMSFDKDLFGEEDDEGDLFGEESGNSNGKKEIKDITDEMFDIAEVESDSDNKITPSRSSMCYETIQQTPLKRKYLDIPLDQITLPNTPLYMDPGAPLPIETPKDRRKSVFAPLNFNPIIESNVDNKYKNGGKFSFDPNEIEEPLKFEVSTTNISSSEEDDSELSGDDFDDLQPNNMHEIRSMEPNIPVLSYDIPPRPMNEFLPSDTTKDDYLIPSYQNSDVIDIDKLPSRESQLDQIWKSPEINREDSPNRLGISSILKPPLANGVNIDSESQNPETGNYFEPTPTVCADEKITTRIPYKDLKQENATDSTIISAVGDYSLISKDPRESSNSLPYLLRHMPLFSIPDVFLSTTPSVKVDDGLEDFLEILCDQLIFDQCLLGDFGVSNPLYRDVKHCQDGVVKDTLKSVFNQFQRLHGNEIIDEMFYLKQPSVYVKKNDEAIKLKSDAEPFTPFLALKPSRGMKNFRALFLSTAVTSARKSFLSELAQIYSGQELGFCELVKLNNDEHNGLITLNNFNIDTLLLLSAQIVSYCSTNMINLKNVPLMIFFPVIGSSLEDTINMTSKFQLIKNEVKSRLPDVELLLKLIPIDFVKDPLVSITSYYELCCSIYNSLPPKTVKFTSIADNFPEKVEFRTSAGSQNQLIHYDSYIHLAYIRSIDREWLSAAWSDSKGTENMVKAWYLGNSKTRFENACNEMWKITVGLASRKYGRICLILTRMDSVLPDDELMHWRRLSVTTRNLHLAVVCVGDNTKVSLFDEDKFYPSFKPLMRDKKNFRKLQPNRLDDYEIVNIDEELHGIIFKSPLQLANSQHRCAIKSGALVRFKPSPIDETMNKFEVNLLNCPHSDSTKLLKIILHQFRDLASLNSWFCISKGKDNYIPWQVVAVKKVMNFLVHVKGVKDKK